MAMFLTLIFNNSQTTLFLFRNAAGRNCQVHEKWVFLNMFRKMGATWKLGLSTQLDYSASQWAKFRWNRKKQSTCSRSPVYKTLLTDRLTQPVYWTYGGIECSPYFPISNRFLKSKLNILNIKLHSELKTKYSEWKTLFWKPNCILKSKINSEGKTRFWVQKRNSEWQTVFWNSRSETDFTSRC